MTRFRSSFVLLGALGTGCAVQHLTAELTRDAGQSPSSGGEHNGGATSASAVGGATVAGATHAGGTDHGSTVISSAGNTDSGGAQASGSSQASGGASSISGSTQSGGGTTDIGGSAPSGGVGNGGTAFSSAGTTNHTGTQLAGTGGVSPVGGTLSAGGSITIGGVTSVGGAPTSGGVTSATGGASTASTGGQQTTGGAATTSTDVQQATGGTPTTVPTAGCGNGTLDANEQCDDGNQEPTDGCSSTCQVETGWQCRKVGQLCVPRCGDNQKVGSETCDDGNKDNTDGCSSTCLTEPGYTCIGTGVGSCNRSVCGDGNKGDNEACDCGTDAKSLPSGCAGPNGFFFGDGTGCSKTCTKEPVCTRNNTAGCVSVCGDGNISGNEVCDDGNTINGDGCSADCSHVEDGFECEAVTTSDAQVCPSNGLLQCLVLPVIYRDFEGQNAASWHPDFFYMGAAVSNGRTVGVTPGATMTTCTPNAVGTTIAFTAGGYCPANDQSGPCTGLVASTLDSGGKPVMAKQKCHCIFTDWDNTGILGSCSGPTCTSSSLPGIQTCYVQGAGDAHLRVEADVNVFQSANSFKQWYTDSSYSSKVLGTLELAATSGGLYEFSSSRPGDPAGSAGRVRADDIHDACLKSGAHTATLSSGFFPLEDQPSTKICNLTSYWMTAIAFASDATCCAGTGCAVKAQFDPYASWDNCPTEGTGGMVPKSDGTGGKLTGLKRNYYFTSEVRYLFRYDGTDGTLSFKGDDDAWVFVNGILAIDLGGTHQPISQDISISATTFKLTVGNIYEIVVFHAKRNPVESNYQLTVPGFSTTHSRCASKCGDGKVAIGEECDLGTANNTGAYGGCKPNCTYAAFCGDGNVDSSEECDDGVNLTMHYDAAHPAACHPGCTLPPP